MEKDRPKADLGAGAVASSATHAPDEGRERDIKAAEIAARILAAGERARAEAAARRAAEPARPPEPLEIGGPGGPEPTRYGDWERKGVASDF